MTAALEHKFWLWPDPDKRWIDMVLKHITENADVGKNFTVLHCTQIPLHDQGVSLTEHIIDLCDKCNLLENNKTTYLSYKDHILALQLCIARLRQKEEGQFLALSSDVLDCHDAYAAQFQAPNSDTISNSVSRAIALYREILKQSNCIDLWKIYELVQCSLEKSDIDLKDFIAKTHYIVIGVPQLEVSKQILKLLAVNKSVQHIVVEVPLDISIKDDYPEDVPLVSSQLTHIEDVLASASSCACEQVSATKEYAEDTMIAFLTLLVNSRNELALSKAMVSPIVDFTHEAFTALKRISFEKDMPMCQTAISFVTRLKLGGKGYAPPENCPLRIHLKGLEQFVELLNHLQTVVEEDTVTQSATRRVINILKNRLLKCGGQKLRKSSVEEAAKNLCDMTVKLIQKMKSKMESTENSTAQCGLESLAVIQSLVNHFNYSSSTYDPLAVLEKSGLCRTPLNLPPLMGYFNSPEEEHSCDSASLQSDVDRSNKNPVMVASPPVVSYVHSYDSNSAFQSTANHETPQKTNFKNCLKQKERTDGQENTSSISDRTTEPKASGMKMGKRSILKDIANDKAHKQNSSKAKRAKTSARPKMKKQIEGQAQITKFFIFHT